MLAAGRECEMAFVMNLDRRGIPGFVLVACLIFVGWWVLRSPQTADSPPRVSTTSPSDPAPPSLPGTDSVPPIATDSAPASATLRGRVIDAATREPVREFQLRFAEWGRSAPDHDVPGTQKFRTQDGRFEWQRLPPGQWGIIAEAAGYQPFITDLQLTKGSTTADWVVPLVRGHTLRGRVFDQSSGAGIAAASISFHEAGKHRYEGNFRLRPRAQSQVGGAFALSGLPAGRITLEVHASNYANRDFDVTVDSDTPPVEIGLSGGGSIEGRITAADGVTPVTGSVGLFIISAVSSGSTASTNGAGEFGFRNLSAGNYRLTGRGPGGTTARDIALADGEHIEGVVLALRGGSTIRGAVTGLRPVELKQLSIAARRAGDRISPGAQASIDERGEYELRDVEPGLVRLSADVSMRRQLARIVNVMPGSDITVDFDFPRGARVSGRVTQRGAPVAGAWLEPRPAETREDLTVYGAMTAQSGHYVIEDVPPGEYTISIDGYKSRPFQVTGDTVFDIDASPQLAGQILEDNGKVPIAEAQLDVRSIDPAASRIWAFDRSDHYGRFAMAGLEPRDFVMTVYKPGYAMFRERVSYVSPTLNMAIRLRRDAGVAVRARDAATGKPVATLRVTEMLGERAGTSVPVPLDEQGGGHIPEALAGTNIAFWADGYVTQQISSWNGESLDLKFLSSADDPPER
jgi:Carboxypeptidase regulatory-like domain